MTIDDDFNIDYDLLYTLAAGSAAKLGPMIRLGLVRVIVTDAGLAALREESYDLSALPQRCRVCGCTDDNCTICVERTGDSCYWVEPDLCSACAISPP